MTHIGDILGRGWVCFMVVLGYALPLTAQRPSQEVAERGPRFLLAGERGALPRALDPSRVSVLTRRISVTLEGATLKEAMAAVARKGGLDLAYSADVLFASPSVHFKAEGMSVAAVLTELLLDARVDVVFSRDGKATLVRRQATLGLATGVVMGRVLEQGTDLPVAAATVTVSGATLIQYTDSKGQYRIPNVPAGTYDITVRRLGFSASSRSTRIADGETKTVDFSLRRVATTLTEVVTTATGDRSRLEVGNAIGTIKADSLVPTTLIRNMSDLLKARVPGLVVSNTTGLLGAPSRIRIRGVNSASLNNDPIVVIDGIRVLAQTTIAATQTNTGPSVIVASMNNLLRNDTKIAPSRLDDIDPDMIESIDVLRGPSASSLYGTEAANGVIIIKTKKGRVGVWRTSLGIDRGVSYIPGRFPEQWVGWGNDKSGQGTDLCALAKVASSGSLTAVEDGSCVQDSVTHFHPENDPQLRTLATGQNRGVSGSLSGGSEQMQQFLSFHVSDNVGMPKLSEIEKRALARFVANPPPSWMARPNTQQAIQGASNTRIRLSHNLDITLNANLSYQNVLNATTGLPASGAGPFGSWDTLGTLSFETRRAKQTTASNRASTSVNANYVPWRWLTLHGTVGGDYTLRSDNALLRPLLCLSVPGVFDAQCRNGHATNRIEAFVTSVTAGLQLAFAPRSWLTLRTALGEQYTNVRSYALYAGSTQSTNLAFGTDLLSPAPVATSGTPQLYDVTENRDESATAGWYVEQSIGLRERVFLTVGVRRDAASAFGFQVNNAAAAYPKFGLSWLVSDETFFPRQPVVSTLRLRSAYGHSGNQGSMVNVVNNYRLTQRVVDGAVVSAINMTKLGNPDLRPERTTEWEGGGELTFLQSERLQTEFTVYRKLSRDAILTIMLPPSYGVATLGNSGITAASLAQSTNVGAVENRGGEVSATARIIDAPVFGWTVTVNWGRNANTLVHKDPAMASTGAQSTEFREGYPLYGWWGFPVVSYMDRNGDGILGFQEVTFGGRTYMASPFPRQEITYRNTVTLLNGALGLSAMLDQVDGMTNNQESAGSSGFAAVPFSLRRCNVDPTCTLAQQAAVIQGRLQEREIRPVSSLRLSEASLTYSMPQALTRRLLRLQSASLTVAGRNLALWTSYAGKDPDGDTSGSRPGGTFGEATSDDGTGVPQPRMWTVRLSLGF